MGQVDLAAAFSTRPFLRGETSGANQVQIVVRICSKLSDPVRLAHLHLATKSRAAESKLHDGLQVFEAGREKMLVVCNRSRNCVFSRAVADIANLRPV